MNIKLIGLLFFWSVLLTMPGIRGSASDTPTAEFIAAALQDQLMSRGASLQVDYTITPSKQLGSGANDVRWKVHYIWTSKVLVLDETTEQRSETTQDWKPGSKTKHRYDMTTGDLQILRTVERSQFATVKRINRISGSRFAPYSVLETAAYPILGTPLYEALKLGPVVKGKEYIDGNECWQVEFIGEQFGNTAAKCIVWLDPTIGFCPRKVQVVPIDKPNVPLITVAFSQYTVTGNNVWYPKTMMVDGVDAQGASVGQVIELTKIDVGHSPSVDDMSSKLPSGTKVDDKTIDAKYTVP